MFRVSHIAALEPAVCYLWRSFAYTRCEAFAGALGRLWQAVGEKWAMPLWEILLLRLD